MGEWLAEHRMLDAAARLDTAALWSSPSIRARQTSAPAGELLGLPVKMTDDLLEATFHVSDHLPVSEGPLDLPPTRDPSPEYAVFKTQAQRALRTLVEDAETTGGTVLAVTHGGLIKTMLRILLGSEVVSFRLYNTAISVVAWNRGRWDLVHLNLWDHLPSHLRTI